MAVKILHIVVKPGYDGVTVYSIRLIKNLPGYEHQLLSCYMGSAFNEIANLNISCHNLVDNSNITNWSIIIKYIRAISFFRKNRFDIIHYHQGGIGLILLAILFGNKAKVLYHIHSGNLIGDNLNKKPSFIHIILLKYLSNRTTQIAVAKHVYKKYTALIKNERNTKLIFNSVPYSFKIKPDIKKTIGYIGRATKEKGYNTFIQITSLIKKHFPKINILVMAESNMNSDIEPLIPTFDVIKIYSNIDILLFPSTAPEGLPLIVLEAISFDVGIITYPLEGVIEILGEDYPLYITNPKDVIPKIEYFYSDNFDRQKLSNIHMQRSKIFNFNEMIGKINSLYNSLIIKN